MGGSDDTGSINGRWAVIESQYHINVLELLAIKLALQSYLPLRNNKKHVRIMTDNTTAITYINNQGGVKSKNCNSVAIDIWNICIKANVYISAAHIPGKHNIIADIASRNFQDAAEWMLLPSAFKILTKVFGLPEIDLFASRLNNQLPSYASWMPDPGAKFIDAMSYVWENLYTYIFPPFSMIWPVVKKISKESDNALIIAPLWPAQTWFPYLMELAIQLPMVIPSTLLQFPGLPEKTHPLAPKLKMIAVFCSRDINRQQEFLQK